jgi:membrane-associated phospholipid phosphatase
VIGLAISLVWRRVQPFLLVLAAVALADAVASLVKIIVRENRPSDPGALITIPHSHSFPSGHTATATAAAIVLSALVPKGAPAFAALAAAIAYSRLYVGVHFPLDIVGGAAIGAATALLLLAAVRRRSTRRRLRGR